MVREPDFEHDKEVEMDLLVGLIEAAVTVGAIALIMILVAFLFPLVVSLATMMDKRVNNQ